MNMKYWGFFLAKLLAVAAVAYGIARAIYALVPRQPLGYGIRDPFLHDLPFTLVIMAYFLFVCGLLWLVVWDQRMRCRTCLRRLRMPVAQGSWHHVLLGPPHTNYICTYGHGTLRVPEFQISGQSLGAWEEHDDIWVELYELESSGR